MTVKPNPLLMEDHHTLLQLHRIPPHHTRPHHTHHPTKLHHAQRTTSSAADHPCNLSLAQLLVMGLLVPTPRTCLNTPLHHNTTIHNSNTFEWLSLWFESNKIYCCFIFRHYCFYFLNRFDLTGCSTPLFFTLMMKIFKFSLQVSPTKLCSTAKKTSIQKKL